MPIVGIVAVFLCVPMVDIDSLCLCFNLPLFRQPLSSPPLLICRPRHIRIFCVFDALVTSSHSLPFLLRHQAKLAEMARAQTMKAAAASREAASARVDTQEAKKQGSAREDQLAAALKQAQSEVPNTGVLCNRV